MRRLTVRSCVLLAAAGFLSFFGSSCSTIISSSQRIAPTKHRPPSDATEPWRQKVSYAVQRVPILSSPRDAEITIYSEDGELIQRGVTPEVIYLGRNFGYFRRPEYRVVIEKTGFERKVYYLKGYPNITWYLAGNFIFGGAIGWLVVDPWTGAMWTLNPSEINAILTPTPGLLPHAQFPTTHITMPPSIHTVTPPPVHTAAPPAEPAVELPAPTPAPAAPPIVP
jgi:hypothetical protein